MMAVNKNKMKLTPLIAVGIYVLVHIIASVILMKTVYSTGGESFEFLINTVEYMMYGILIVTISTSLFNYKWAIKYWWIVLILLVIGFSPLIIDVMANPE